MLTIAARTHVDRTERASMVSIRTVVIVILDSRRWRSTERRYMEILTIVVMLVAGDTGRAWIWSMVTSVSVSLGASRSRKVTNQFARQNPVGTFPLQIQGFGCHCP